MAQRATAVDRPASRRAELLRARVNARCRYRRALSGIIALVATLLVVAPPAPPAATPGIGAWSEFTTFLDSRVPSLMARYDVPGAAVGVVSSGQVVWSGVYGDAELDPSRPTRQDTLFRAESISKPVTAWGVLRLVDTGLVKLDAPVAQYLPAGTLPDLDATGATVRQLLSHTAGMPLGTIGVRYAPQEARPSLLEDLQTEARVDHPPGEAFAYSNVGYNLLELMVEHVTGRDFSEYMDKEVLNPLGMDASTYSWPESRSHLLATGHLLSGVPVLPYVYPTRASGGLHTTVNDVARFVAAGSAQHQQSNPVLTAASIDLAHTSQVDALGIYDAVADGYALGHFFEEIADGRTAVWHGGQGTGWMTHFHLLPDTGDGIVILTNSQRAWPLIGAVLKDWANWTGTGPVQMSRITDANTVLRITLIVVAVGTIMWASRLARGAITGTRRFAPLAPQARAWRIVQAAASAAVLAGLAWAAAQPYLIVSSLFPSYVAWAAAWATATALLVLCAAALPPRRVGEVAHCVAGRHPHGTEP